MKTRHIAFLGFTALGVLAFLLAGCSADTATKATPKKDGGASTTSAGAGGASGTTTAGAGGDSMTTGTPGVGGMNPTTGAGGGPVDCTPPDTTTKAAIAVDPAVLADFEGDAPGAVMNVAPGGGWYSYTDSEVGAGLPAMFTPAPGAFVVEAGGANGTGSALHVVGSGFAGGVASATVWGAGVGVALGGAGTGGIAGAANPPVMPTDLSAFKGLTFMAKSSMMSDVVVQFGNPSTDPSYCTCQAASLCYTGHAKAVTALTATWTKYTVLFTDLTQPTYVMAPVPFDPASVLTINFASNGPVAMFDYWIDDITFTK